MKPLPVMLVESVPEVGVPTSWIVAFAGLVGLLVVGAALALRNAEFRRGLALGLGGLVAKELRSRSRGWRPMLVLTGYLAALTVGVAGFLALMGQASGVVFPNVGTVLFLVLAIGCVLLLAFTTPALTVGAISGERERRTLDLLLVTRASALGIVAGKLAGSLLYILFLLVASLPAFTLVYLFGGVPPRYLALVLVVAASTALAHAALGLLLSALLRRTLVASLAAYFLVLGLVLGIPFIATVVGITQQVQGYAGAVVMAGPGGPGVAADAEAARPTRALLPPSAHLFVSPLFVLTSVLPGEALGFGSPFFFGGFPFPTMLLGGSAPPPDTGLALSFFDRAYVAGFDPATGQPEIVVAWAPWVYQLAWTLALTAVSLLWSALALAPVKPWRAWRARRRRTALAPEASSAAG
jgi:ABC-type transport system involved in multi-copper enzyme maturation permease subunit